MDVVALGPTGDGCAFYRVDQPLGVLSGRGHRTNAVRAWHRGRPFNREILVGLRLHLPRVSRFYKTVARSHPTVYEIDDRLWGLDRESPIFGYYDDKVTKYSIGQNMGCSSLVTTTNEVLAEECAYVAAHDRVAVLPNMIPQSLLDMPQHQHHHDGPVVIGYPASKSHYTDMVEMRDGLTKVCRKLGRHVEFRSIGYDFRDELRIAGTHVPWVRSMDAHYANLDFDILVAPLKATRFNECKSEIKVLECAARGIPVVASNFGPYSRYVKNGDDGLLVDRAGWYGALRDLVSNDDRRERMGQAARARAEERTYEGNVHLWEDAYASVL